MTEENDKKAGEYPRDFGEYTIRGELGRGAMGVVYDAVDRRLDRPVALKILKGEADPESQAFRRFQREAKSCASVRHDHIVEVYEAGEVGGRPFYAMTRVEGESLAELAKSGKLPEPRVLFGRLAGIADALEALHEAGIVHRDVKPSNILVQPDGRMILADFGLARTATAGDLTQTGEALGTPIYMSPEQALGKQDEIDGLTDVYSLGATIYEALAGRPVFDAEDTRGMMIQVLREPPRPLREARPDVPKECESVVLKALEKEKRDRYVSAGAMRDDLVAFSRGEAVVGRPVSRTRRAVRKWKWHAAAAAAVVLLVVGAFVIASRGNGQDSGTKVATLTVLSTPPAEVILNGEPVGLTPFRQELDAGEYSLLMRQPGFRNHTQKITLEPGEKRTFERVLEAQDPDDPVALGQLADALNLPCAHLGDAAAEEFRRPSRGMPEVGAVKVTTPEPAELSELAERTINMVFADNLLLLESKGETVSSDLPAAKEDMSRELRKILVTADKMVWNVRPREGVAADAGRREQRIAPEVWAGLAKLKKRLDGQDPKVVHHLTAQYYLNNNLPLHAFVEAKELAGKGKPSPQTLLVMKDAMEAMGLTDCENWKRVLADLRKVPPAQRRKLLRARRGAQRATMEKPD